ncbi:hypothetical protein EG103P1_00030 [Enterococcus phage EG103P1]|nr:hypothetical protein EG103P1_00030 [Enterococcus phage EG103P1]
MVKKLFEVYVTYGKGDGEELRESWVAEDTPEERTHAWALTYADDWYESPDDFIAGYEDSITFYTSGDWDDPTGGWLQVQSYEEKREDLANEYDKEVKRLKKQFGRGE